MIKTTRFDVAEYLDTPKRQAEYISAALETGDVAFVCDAVTIVDRARQLTLAHPSRRGPLGRSSG